MSLLDRFRRDRPASMLDEDRPLSADERALAERLLLQPSLACNRPSAVARIERPLDAIMDCERMTAIRTRSVFLGVVPGSGERQRGLETVWRRSRHNLNPGPCGVDGD